MSRTPVDPKDIVMTAVRSCTPDGDVRSGVTTQVRELLDRDGPDAVVTLAAHLACVAAEAIESFCRLQGYPDHELVAAADEWLDATS